MRRLLSSCATRAAAPSPRLAALRETLKKEAAPAAQPRLAALRETLKKESQTPAKARKPSWLKAPAAAGANYERLRSTVRKQKLATVCEEARCPNIGECWGGRAAAGDESNEEHTATATIMIMGDTCTRGCRFCSVKTSRRPDALDPEEPLRTADAVNQWGLDYVVVTSVDRDDVHDHGSSHISETVRQLKLKTPHLLVEVLTPDFGGVVERVNEVALSGLDVFAHNVETVERLTPRVRDRRAGYQQTMNVLQAAKAANPALVTKSSIMLGLGETDDEILQTLRDLRKHGVDVVTFGQYLQPTKRHLKVADYVTPEAFDRWRDAAQALGFLYVASGPLVRSSYRAGELFVKNVLRGRKPKKADVAEPLAAVVASTGATTAATAAA